MLQLKSLSESALDPQLERDLLLLRIHRPPAFAGNDVNLVDHVQIRVPRLLEHLALPIALELVIGVHVGAELWIAPRLIKLELRVVLLRDDVDLRDADDGHPDAHLQWLRCILWLPLGCRIRRDGILCGEVRHHLAARCCPYLAESTVVRAHLAYLRHQVIRIAAEHSFARQSPRH